MANKPNNAAPGQAVGRKLSVASFGFNKPTLQALVIGAQADRHFLARFVGVVTGLKPYKITEGARVGETGYGLQGQFEGTDVNGETLFGSVLYLPGYINDTVVAAFSSSEEITRVSIAFDIYAQYDDTSATSYVFSGNDLINTGSEGVDEVKAMITSLPMPPKQLALGSS